MRQIKMACLIGLVGMAVWGALLAQKKTPSPKGVPLVVTFADGTADMMRSDLGGAYINGVDGVKAEIDLEYGEFKLEVAKTSPRRVLLEFGLKTSCEGAGYPDCGGAPPGVGTVNYFVFVTSNRAWSEFGRYLLRMLPNDEGRTDVRILFSIPKLSMFNLRFQKACADPPQESYAYVRAGDDLNGDGWADSWDLYPGPLLNADLAVLTLIQSGGRICNFGLYSVPFRIHIEKL